MIKKEYDVIIIGAGPAGLSASIYTSRAELDTLLIGKYHQGALYKAVTVGNYMGYSKDVSGKLIIDESVAQTKRYGTDILEEEAVNVVKENSKFKLKTDTGNELTCKALIIACGKAYKMSNIKNEKELTGHGVSYCVTCDGYFFRNKKIAVLGNKNHAAAEALQLLSYTRDITIFSNGREFELGEELEKEVNKNNIKLRNEKILEFKSNNGKLESFVFSEGNTEKFDGMFIALGTTSAFNFATKLGLEIKETDIRVDNEMKTNVAGVFAAGDCTGCYPQAAVSSGQGCIAGISAIRYIKGKDVYIDYD